MFHHKDVTVVPLIFLHLALYLRILRSPDISENRACRIVALSHGDRVGYSIYYYVKYTGKYHIVPETAGKPDTQESVSVALSH